MDSSSSPIIRSKLRCHRKLVKPYHVAMTIYDSSTATPRFAGGIPDNGQALFILYQTDPEGTAFLFQQFEGLQGTLCLLLLLATNTTIDGHQRHAEVDTAANHMSVHVNLGLLTFCVLVLRNGFTVTGESACASPENFDAEIGRKVARANAVQHGANIRFLEGSWYAPLGGERFDIVVSNPPYIVAGDPHLLNDGLPFEPREALTDGVLGGNGMACIRELIDGAPSHLSHGGWILIEHGYDQAVEVRELLQKAGFSGVGSWLDAAAIDRVSGGFLP